MNKVGEEEETAEEKKRRDSIDDQEEELEMTEAFEDRTEAINKITNEMGQLSELFSQVN